MADYIKRSDARAVIERFKGYLDDDMQYRIKFMLNRDCPAADVREVVHARWLDNGIPNSVLSGCSVCGYSCGASNMNFCPSCGADMREDTNDTQDAD